VVVMRENRLVAYLATGGSGKQGPEFWPSVAEHYVYDELLYLAMIKDERRNEAYRAALKQAVAGKVVVDVGTGPEALLARLCLECGAKKVYAVEYLQESYERASQYLTGQGLTDRIELIQGDVREVALPEKADVCVSELVGPIGSMEGVVP